MCVCGGGGGGGMWFQVEGTADATAWVKMKFGLFKANLLLQRTEPGRRKQAMSWGNERRSPGVGTASERTWF